ncbi:hypothetical protein BJF92_12075 [Rhizobium rhizosphaerae]|uniref:Uncharacterized protein n=1 Tax=Xaviernesmea rhizosphaerae TaxID=1672749 RepID=A0A1Q9AN30_9HYPH|nr:hypothetical protein [Xaviernesmea rhizosphaerae]OLP56802.1 hypothetical protein BJF92_12075 [Xaviernesmea rhizosphaerae]
MSDLLEPRTETLAALQRLLPDDPDEALYLVLVLAALLSVQRGESDDATLVRFLRAFRDVRARGLFGEPQ